MTFEDTDAAIFLHLIEADTPHGRERSDFIIGQEKTHTCARVRPESTLPADAELQPDWPFGLRPLRLATPACRCRFYMPLWRRAAYAWGWQKIAEGAGQPRWHYWPSPGNRRITASAQRPTTGVNTSTVCALAASRARSSVTLASTASFLRTSSVAPFGSSISSAGRLLLSTAANYSDVQVDPSWQHLLASKPSVVLLRRFRSPYPG